MRRSYQFRLETELIKSFAMMRMQLLLGVDKTTELVVSFGRFAAPVNLARHWGNHVVSVADHDDSRVSGEVDNNFALVR